MKNPTRRAAGGVLHSQPSKAATALTTTTTIIGLLTNHGCNPRQSRDGQWTSRCPNQAGHRNGDKHPSLSIGEAADGRTLIHCATGCQLADITRAIGITIADLHPAKPATNQRQIVATYDYHDADGTLVMQAVRYDPKGFAQRQPDGNGGWHWHLRGLDERPLYRLPQILRAVAAGETIWVVEGEKDADALVAAGFEATCNPMGAGKWRPEHTRWLGGAATVEIVADNDPAGVDHARRIQQALVAGNVNNIRMWRPPPPCSDIAELLGQGRRISDLLPLATDPEPDNNTNVDQADITQILINWDTFWATDHTSEDWLAWPILAVGRQTALYAPAKTGKSLVTLAVVAALAAGQPILGRPAQPPRNVLYIDLEMTAADLHERLDGLGYGPHSDLSHLHYASLPTLPPLNTVEGAAMLLELAQAVDAEAVVIDTTSRAIEGDENDSAPYRDFARHTGLALKAAGIAALRTDHAGKDKDRGQRGSSAKNDDVDIVMRLDTIDGGWVLNRTHSRVGWVPERVEISRNVDRNGIVELSAPETVAMWPAGTKQLAEQMDVLAVPVDATRDKARQMGIKARSGLINAALKYRRERRHGGS